MATVGVDVIETAALGRPFQLGMLYDCRKDALIPGITLWDPEKLQQSLRTRPQINTDFKVTASDSIEDKSSLLNIDGSLKLSLLGGLVSVTGAAKYLNDTKKSFRQQRLTLHYHSTCRFEELTMSHLAPENIIHQLVFDNDTATHVVTAVLYGADACFVFDREVSSDENKNTVEGEVNAALDKLKFISVDVKISLKMNDAQKNAVQKFTCTFYGDFQLPSNPTNFEDALKVFTDLPKLLGEKKELAVPLRVWLYPLDKLHSRASKLQKDISMDLILETESVVESLNTAEMRCRDLLKDSPASSFTAFHDTILQMKQNCYKYKLKLTKRLGSLLPNIRGDVMKETALNELLQEHEESPFRRSDLAEWLKERERESEIVKSVLRQLKDAGAQVEVNIDLILMDLEVGNLVCFMFTSLNWSDMLLLQQKACLSPSAKGGNNDSSPERKQKSWLSPEIQKTMRSNLKMFKNLIDLNDSTSNMFIVSSREMKNNPGSCILLYESECDEAVCFIPPSPPACPVIEEVKENTVVVKVPPLCPDTVEIKLLYKPKQDSVWTSEPVMKDQDVVTLTDLRSGTEYEIKCAALGKLNYTTDSDVIEVTTERRNRSVMAYCGLMNQGATSYLNAVLQTLYMTQEYREGVVRLERRDDSPDGDFTEELKSLFDKLDKESHPVSTAAISKSLGITDVYKEEDAAKCLELILIRTPKSSKIFKGTVEKTSRCDSCKQIISERLDFFTMSISLCKSRNVGFALKEHIDQMHQASLSCSQCSNKSAVATKSHVDFPQILILQLRTFRHDNNGQVRIPAQTEVYFQKYELYAIINLYGTLKDGHYNTNIRSDNQNWYRCDDSHVFQIPDKMFSERTDVLRRIAEFVSSSSSDSYYSHSSAYLLLYKKRD
ncbi:verrucotoxin subunit beta-like [Sinocyclocheilus anshuiensis]|uniref:verrucotoxin subunit beta-like n=1 Tax=Sinocyclocheilus anshuiensis TaxID=1608454 RepID=UPI0007BA36D3|nr:PREDICTED: verrucotoxin subunit beta-like [Sinocyclocheilus anshuiensis]XP_016335941.1 PREDICTED: verrucotoxin subunit beta-like [Sinocyclocheilus anshuiensis]